MRLRLCLGQRFKARVKHSSALQDCTDLQNIQLLLQAAALRAAGLRAITARAGRAGSRAAWAAWKAAVPPRPPS